KDEKLAKDMKDAEDKLKDPKGELTPKLREDWTKYYTSLKRQREDLTAELKQKLADVSDKQIVQLYKEVEEAVQKYALSNGFHLVSQYNESPNAKDRENPTYITQKLQRAGGACVPLYMAGGLDISTAIVNNLNQAYQPPAAATPGAATPAAAT